jgi:uncharacterized protein (DUF2164 family)
VKEKKQMDYWNEVKRIQIKLKSALGIGTEEATGIIESITGKLGYFFYVGNKIRHADSRDNVFRMIAEIEKSGKEPETVAALKAHYKDAKEYIVAEELTDAETAQSASKLEQVIRQLETEVDTCIANRAGK